MGCVSSWMAVWRRCVSWWGRRPWWGVTHCPSCLSKWRLGDGGCGRTSSQHRGWSHSQPPEWPGMPDTYTQFNTSKSTLKPIVTASVSIKIKLRWLYARPNSKSLNKTNYLNKTDVIINNEKPKIQLLRLHNCFNQFRFCDLHRPRKLWFSTTISYNCLCLEWREENKN